VLFKKLLKIKHKSYKKKLHSLKKKEKIIENSKKLGQAVLVQTEKNVNLSFTNGI